MWRYILWGVGGLLALAVGSRVVAARKGEAPAPATSQSAMPLFLSSGNGGGLASTQIGTTDLPFGDVWTTPEVPLSENPDVAIANINREIALAQIAAQKDIAKSGFSALLPQNGSAGLTGNGDGVLMPNSWAGGFITPDGKMVQSDFFVDPAVYNVPAQGPSPSRSSGGKVSTREAVLGIQSIVGKAGGGLNDNAAYGIYNQARNRGYSASETAALLNRAGVGGGRVISSAEVNTWARQHGLNTL